MKKAIAVLMVLCMLLGVGALAESDALVIYFSCTGTTRGVAEKLANVTGADLYEIVPAVPYTEEDLNYNDRSTRATSEQDHPEARPEIGGEDVDLTGYSTIYIGYPIWSTGDKSDSVLSLSLGWRRYVFVGTSERL